MIPNEKLVKASYLVALRVARAKKAHTVAEELILPSAVDMCDTVLGKESAAKLKSIPLSDNTIARRIEDMSDDIKAQLIDRLKQGYFAIQLDESTDIASQSQLLVYVRYCWEEEMIEDFLFCYAMPSRLPEPLVRRSSRRWTIFFHSPVCRGIAALAYAQTAQRP